MARKRQPRAPAMQIRLNVRYVTLPKEENDERIERLARKILRILENPGKQPRHDPTQAPSSSSEETTEELFNTSFEKFLGI